jgi:alpha-tubulin suppressor-like RCC1 family protein
MMFLIATFCRSVNVCRAGMVFSCGNGLYGQLGNGANVEIQDRAIQIRNLKDIHLIAAGHYHSVAVSQVRPKTESRKGSAASTFSYPHSI